MKLIRAQALFLGILLLIAALGVGCGNSSSEVLAVVGDHDITVQEFEEFFEAKNVTFASADEEFSKKRQLLDTIINNRLLARAAEDRGIDRSEELTRAVLANKDKFLLDALYYKEVTSKAKVTEAEIKDYYDKLEYQYRASHILVSTEDTAKMLLEKIKAGGNFDQLAYDYSTDPSAKRNKGDLGYFSWGTMVDEFQEAVYKMNPGEVSPPVKTRFGYHIIKLVDKLPNENRTDYIAMRSAIETQLKNRKLQRLAEAYMEGIKAKYSVTIDTVTCEYLFHRRSQLYPPQVLEGLPRNDFDMKQLDRNERELVLASWNGGQISLGEYLENAKQIPMNMRPNLDDYDSLRTVVFMMKQEDILAAEALKSGIDNDPRYLRKMSLFKDLTMGDILRNDSIKPPPPPPDSILYEYYQTHIEDYSVAPKVHLYEILLSDELKAKKLKESIKSLNQFKDQAMDLTLRPDRKEVGGDLGYIERKQLPTIYAEAEKTPVGEIGGPVATGVFFSIFYVADKIPSTPKDFLVSKQSIITKLQQDARDQVVRDLVADMRAKLHVKIKDDVLWSTIDKAMYANAAAAPSQN